MASGWYNKALADIMNGSIDLDSHTLKIMLVGTGYTYDPDDDFIEEAANDPNEEEITATNYTAGFGGAGRKTATITIVEQDASNRGIAVIGDLTWSVLGNGTNDTIAAGILVKEITNDAASILIAYFDVTNTLTDGKDIKLDFLDAAAGGNLRITVA